MNYPTSDIQFVAQMLRKVRAGDQVPASEEYRLDQIAEKGYSDQPMTPQPPKSELPDGMAVAQYENATRAQRSIDAGS